MSAVDSAIKFKVGATIAGIAVLGVIGYALYKWLQTLEIPNPNIDIQIGGNNPPPASGLEGDAITDLNPITVIDNTLPISELETLKTMIQNQIATAQANMVNLETAIQANLDSQSGYRTQIRDIYAQLNGIDWGTYEAVYNNMIAEANAFKAGPLKTQEELVLGLWSDYAYQKNIYDTQRATALKYYSIWHQLADGWVSKTGPVYYNGVATEFAFSLSNTVNEIRGLEAKKLYESWNNKADATYTYMANAENGYYNENSNLTDMNDRLDALYSAAEDYFAEYVAPNKELYAALQTTANTLNLSYNLIKSEIDPVIAQIEAIKSQIAGYEQKLVEINQKILDLGGNKI
jgi:predicted  nucleic acid-binding Zn-ribbon protein